jgi:hypothetical protein
VCVSFHGLSVASAMAPYCLSHTLVHAHIQTGTQREARHTDAGIVLFGPQVAQHNDGQFFTIEVCVKLVYNVDLLCTEIDT